MRKFLFFLSLINYFGSYAQGVYAPLQKDYYNLIDRYEIRNGNFVPNLHTTFKAYQRKDIVTMLDSVQNDSANFTKVDRFNINYLYADNWQHTTNGKEISKKPVFKHFYKTKSDLYSVNSGDFKLRVNPVAYFQTGSESNNPYRQFVNTRGIQVEGSIDGKIGFYTFMADNQAVLPFYVNDQIKNEGTYYGEGFLKRVRITVTDTVNGVPRTYETNKPESADFFTARGYFTFKATKHINGQFGHGKQFIGNGYRSLILSDNATNYLYLRINTKIWKFNYTNLFAEMNAGSDLGADKVIEKKYLALHHLSLNILKNLNVGVWESIPFGRNGRYFELQYLNPIIFYRSVEQQLGSGDNAILGADMHYNFLNHFQLYGQLVLDEFKISHLKARDGWWGNKQAAQVGLKYVDVAGISNLDMQTEFNYIRPYTYSHKNDFTNYTHYTQPLAHPVGANIREIIGIIRYQPIPKLNIVAKIINTGVGLDKDSLNYGNSVRNYGNRVKYNKDETGHRVLQGEFVNIRKIDITLSYMFKYNLFFDLQLIMRDYNSEIDANDNNTTIIGAAMRWNIGQRRHDF